MPGPIAITFLPLTALEEADLFWADDNEDDDALPFVAETDGLGSLDEDAMADVATTLEDFLLSGAVVFAQDCLLLAADSVRGICPPWLILLGFIAAPTDKFFFFGSGSMRQYSRLCSKCRDREWTNNHLSVHKGRCHGENGIKWTLIDLLYVCSFVFSIVQG